MTIHNETELKDYLLNGGLASRLRLVDVDLSKSDLTGLDLRGIRLTSVNLRGATLEDVDMTGAVCLNSDFSNTRFVFAKCVDSKFESCDFKGASIRHSCFIVSKFIESSIVHAGLSYSSFINSVFIKSNLDGSSICHSCFYGTCFDHSSIFDTNFYGSNLVGATLDNAFWVEKAKFELSNIANTFLDAREEIRKGIILQEPIIGYKKCRSTLDSTLFGKRKHVVVELEVPAGAIVFSINNGKCRTNKALVKRIYGGDRGFSTYGRYLSYYPGDEINIKDFDLMYNVECGTGVHFFRTYEEAANYKT